MNFLSVFVIFTGGLLCRLLESESSPLRLANEVQQELAEITSLNKEEYTRYVEAIKGVSATKIIKQISTIYDALSLERIQKVIPFYSGVELERFLVNIAKQRCVKVFYLSCFQAVNI